MSTGRSIGNRDRTDSTEAVPRTPVIIVATSPFTIIGFDENDRLEATFDHINYNTYDYVRFCRTTMALDAEFAQPVPAIISYTSCFLFPMVRGVTKRLCIEATNRIIFRLFFGGIFFDAAKPNDVAQGYLNHTGYFRFTSGARGDNADFISALQSRMTGQDRNPRLFNPRFFTSAEITKRYWDGRNSTNRITPVNPSLFMNGISDFHAHDYESALVFTWTFVEQLLEIIWHSEVVMKAEKIFKRRSFLKSRTWGAAVRAEVLFQKGLLDEGLYEDLSRARDDRNRLIHKGERPGFETCKRALRSSIQLVSLIQSNYSRKDMFSKPARIIQMHSEIDRPMRRIVENPVMWREILHIPGDQE